MAARLIAFARCAFALCSGVAAAQGRAVEVTVLDSATTRPLERVSVGAVGGTAVFTDARGRVAFDAATLRGGSVVVRKLGFKPETLSAEAFAGDKIRIAMYKLSELPTVTIAGENRREDFSGFEARCAMIYAECVGVDELSLRSSRRISDFLVKMGGAKRECAGRLDDCKMLMVSTVTNGRCEPTYFLDGFKWVPGPANALRRAPASSLTELEKFLVPSGVKGIEVYRAGQPMPQRFDPGNGCGAIVIWTR